MMVSIVDVLKNMPGYIGSTGRNKGEIDQAEKELEVSFAEDYRKYLSEIGLACFDGREFTGLTKTARLDVVSTTKEQREQLNNVDASWYVIEEAHIDGIVIWQSPDGSIYATAPNSKARKIANSLSEYVSK